MGRGSGLIKMSFLPLVLSQCKFNVNTSFFLFLFFDMLLLFFFPFMGSLSNVEPRFFFLFPFFNLFFGSLSLVSLNFFFFLGSLLVVTHI